MEEEKIEELNIKFYDEEEMVKKATLLQDEYELAKQEKAPWNEKFDREEQTYTGDRKFGNTLNATTRDDARTPVRISQTVIEAQIDLNIPEAVFKPVARDDENVVKRLQAEAEYTVRSCDLEEINSQAERDCKKYGITVYKVLWNPNYIGAGYRGRPEIISVHPKNILWAAGTVDKNKARAMYHVENVTLQECVQRYGDIARKLPQFGELADANLDTVGTQYASKIQNTNDVSVSETSLSRGQDHPLTKYLVVEKWYLDNEDELCLVVFSNHLILKDMKKFYHRRKFNVETNEFEYDENGNEIFDDEEIIDKDVTEDFADDEGNNTTEIRVSAGTVVQRYFPKGPKTIPIVIQNNIPRSKSVVGISDIERTYDIEQSMKKMLHKYEECMLKGNAKIAYNKNLEEEAAGMLDNDDLNIVPVNDVNNIKILDLNYNNRAALEFFQFLLEHLQYSIGITSVWQGINKSEAMSGKMTESLINQTAEKINIKINEKNIAYKRIYRLLCDFILCFSDGDRPYRLDSKFKTEYGTFNRRSMIRKDDAGNHIYADWDVEIAAETGLARNNGAIINSVIQMAQYGMLEAVPRNVLVWTILARQNFPCAEIILEMLREQVGQMQPPQVDEEGNPIQGELPEQQAGQPQIQPQQPQKTQGNAKELLKLLPPQVRQAFMSLPPEQMATIMGG